MAANKADTDRLTLPRLSKKTTQVKATVDDELAKAVSHASKRNGISIATATRIALVAYVRDDKRKELRSSKRVNSKKVRA